jgi:hypothetical protein
VNWHLLIAMACEACIPAAILLGMITWERIRARRRSWD